MTDTNEHPAAPEQRTIDVDVRDLDTRGRTVVGYAAVYGAESGDLGGFRERIAPGAFAGVLDADVRCLLNHDPNVVLGRTKSGTMRLADDQRGLRFEVDLPESRSDLREAVGRGDLDGASFRFQVGDEEWDGDLRTVKTVKSLHDVTLATYPAYPASSIELRTRPENTTTAAEPQENDTMETEDRNEAQTSEQTEDRTEGGLQVEDRAAVAEERSVEDRLNDAFRTVQVGEVRALNTTDDASIAPAELSTFLFEGLRASSVALRSGITVVATDRESISWPKLSTDVSPDFYSEAGTITPGDPGLETLTAEPAKIAHITEASNEVIDDSAPSVVNVLNSHVTTMLGLKLDASIYEGGTAVPGITGMANTSGIQNGGTVSVGGTASWDPIVQAIGDLREANAPEPYAVAGPPSTFTELSLLKTDSTDSNEQLPRPEGVPEPLQSTQLTDVYVYSPSQVVLVRRQDATVELDRSRLFNSDQSEVRGKVRADVLFPNPTAIVQVTASD